MVDPGKGPGGPGPPLFLDQTEVQRAEKKNFFETEAPPPPLSGGLDPLLSLVTVFMFTCDLCC